ncbi:uncharacterized protein LOC120289713 [Eucalyptus grandis]|uniref:uncharacterized protein LOC120289713 n=1 Tax=Eucalyptus grandis TaxID=71139 RepID=UPI00192EB0DC|nr:uncharacterized protein LOC120289713 [Eucalyptus grandis]
MTYVRHCASSVSDLNPAAFTASICQAAPSLPQRHFLEGSTDVKLFIEEEDIGMNTSTREEVQKYEEGPSLSNASATAPTAEKQDLTNVYAAAKKLADVIKGANVEDINSTIETLACQTDSFAIFNFRGYWVHCSTLQQPPAIATS